MLKKPRFEPPNSQFGIQQRGPLLSSSQQARSQIPRSQVPTFQETSSPKSSPQQSGNFLKSGSQPSLSQKSFPPLPRPRLPMAHQSNFHPADFKQPNTQSGLQPLVSQKPRTQLPTPTQCNEHNFEKKDEKWNTVFSNGEKKRQKAKRLTQLQVFPNPEFQPHSNGPPFFHQSSSPEPIPEPKPSPPPQQNPWAEEVTVHIYQDSNGKMNPGYVDQVVQNYKRANNVQTKYKTEYHNTFTLPRTFREMENRDHSNSIVLINIGTNDIRFRKEKPEHWLSRKDPKSWVKRMISLLKNQTTCENIVIVESPPSSIFNMTTYNKENFDLCA